LLFAVKLNDAAGGICNDRRLRDAVGFGREIVTDLFAMPALLPVVSTTLCCRCCPSAAVGPLSGRGARDADTHVFCALPLMPVTVIVRFVWSPAVLSVAVTAPFLSVVGVRGDERARGCGE
jgi:hypothetical protein